MDRVTPRAALPALLWLLSSPWLAAASGPVGAGRPVAAVAARSASAAPEEIVVAPGTLAQLLARAAEGTHLRLAPGRHDGPLVIDRRLTLIGSPGAEIVGPGSGTVVTVRADGASLLDLNVRGGGADLAEDDAVIMVEEAHGVTVRGCRVQARAFGIYLRGGGGHRLLGNHVVGDAALEVARRGNGVHLWHSSANEVRDNRLEAVRDGVYLSFAHDNLVAGNHGSGLRYGIHYMYSERNRLVGNGFLASTGGIALMYSKDNEIRANEVAGNAEFGILALQLEDSLVADNEARGNGRGLFLQNAAGNRFLGNRLQRNGVGVYLSAGSENNLLAGNVFLDNLVQAYARHAGANAWSAAGRGNYWSDYLGFDWDGDGIGDAPYRLRRASAALLARVPAARLLARSPALGLLDWWSTRFGVRAAADRAVLDPHPLMHPLALR